MAELAAYFDDSGHPDDQPVVVVGGFIATEEQWLVFEKEWKDVLQAEGIESFHRADFGRTRRRVLDRLLNIILTRTRYHITQAVLMNDYRQANEEFVLEEFAGTPYAIAGRTVAKSIAIWREKYTKPEDRLLVFFEDGTKHKGDLMHAMERDTVPCPAFIKKTETVPLQAADFLAGEVFTAVKGNRISPHLVHIFRQPGDDGIYEVEDLKRLADSIAMPRRAGLSPDTQIVSYIHPKKLRRRTIK